MSKYIYKFVELGLVRCLSKYLVEELQVSFIRFFLEGWSGVLPTKWKNNYNRKYSAGHVLIKYTGQYITVFMANTIMYVGLELRVWSSGVAIPYPVELHIVFAFIFH